MNPSTVASRPLHQAAKDFSATHARAVAFALATLLALATMVLMVLLLAREQWKDIDAGQQQAATTGQEVAKESTEVLLRLNRNFQPDCSDEALRDFRVEQFLAPYVSDIGVLDAQGRLVCTTTLGMFAQPIALTPADITTRSLQGETVHLSFNVPVMASRSSVRSVVMGMGRFNLVISPGVVKGMLSAGIDAARFLPPQGQSLPVFVSPQLPEVWKTRLATTEFSDKALKEFFWDGLAFVAVRPIPDTRYVAQSVVTLDAFAKNYFFGVLAALLTSLVVALLSYAAALPVFLSWNGLAHRIPGLLTDANIICMYQPIVDLRTGKTVGCEVLMRLRDGDAVVYPDQALPAIVSRHLTWELDQAVVRVAVRELAQALPDITDFKVAFNFFPENIKSEKVHALIGGAARRRCTSTVA